MQGTDDVLGTGGTDLGNSVLMDESRHLKTQRNVWAIYRSLEWKFMPDLKNLRFVMPLKHFWVPDPLRSYMALSLHTTYGETRKQTHSATGQLVRLKPALRVMR